MKRSKFISAVLSIAIASIMMIVPASAISKLEAPTNLKAASKSTSSITLTWDSVDGASKYLVYFSTEKKSEFEKYGSTTKTSSIVKNLTAGKRYYFRVYACKKVDGKTVKSSYSAATAIVKKVEIAESADGVKVITSPGKVQNGKKATLKIKGKPKTAYTLYVHYPTKSGEAKGIGSVWSDENGYAEWTWTVGTRTTPGKHEIVVMCGKEKYELGSILETYKKNG